MLVDTARTLVYSGNQLEKAKILVFFFCANDFLNMTCEKAIHQQDLICFLNPPLHMIKEKKNITYK